MRRPVMAVAAAVTAAAMSTAGCGVGLQDLPMGRSAGSGAMEVTVQLESAIGLVHGAEVRTGQKVIGRVAAMDIAPGGAEVRLSLDGDTALPADTLAVVELPTALGSPHIRLIDPGTGGPDLVDGAVIAQSRTELGPRIESTLAGMGLLLDGGGIGRLDTVVAELHTAFAGRAPQLTELTDTAEALMASAAANRDAFDRALLSAAVIVDRAAGGRAVIDASMDTVPELVAVLADQHETIDRLLAATAELAAAGDQITAAAPDHMAGLVTDTAAVVDALDDFSADLAVSLDNLRRFLTDFDRAVRGDYLTFVGTADIDGTIQSMMFGPAGPPPGSPPELIDQITAAFTEGGPR